MSQVSYHVRDASGGVVADHAGSFPRAGGSTAKLLTVDAALRVLGPDHRFRVRIRHDGQHLYLEGCHPWIQVPDLVRLARSLTTTADALLLDDTRYPPFTLPSGWDTQDLPLNVQPVMPLNLREYFGYDPAVAVAEAVAGVLCAQGHPTRYAGRARARGTVVAELESPPVRDLAVECLQSSHNLMAEILGRETAIASGLPPTFESMQATLVAGLDTDTAGIVMRDASGLCRHDRMRADVLTHVLHRWLEQGDLGSEALPLAGLTGTLSGVNDWFQVGPAAALRGFVQAKSGTNVDCVALAGFTFAPQRPLRVFAVLVDGLSGPSPHLPMRRQVEEFTRLVASAQV